MKTLRNKRESITRSPISKQRIIVSAFLIILICSMSIGYATYYTELSLAGNVKLIDTAGIKPTAMSVSNTTRTTAGSYNVYRTYTDSTTNVIAKTKATFNGWQPSITYSITIKNCSEYKTYYYTGLTYSNTFKDSRVTGTGSSVHLAAPVINGLNVGTRIRPGQSVTFTMRYYYGQNCNTNYIFDGETIFKFSTNDTDIYLPQVNLSLDTNSFDLPRNNRANTNAHIHNLYDSSIEYTLSLSNPNVELVDANGNPAEYSGILNANQQLNFPIYFHVVNAQAGFKSIETDLVATLSNGAKFTAEKIYLYEFEDRPTIKPTQATSEYYCEPAAGGSWLNHYICYFTITNTGTQTINQWTLEYHLAANTQITSIQNWNDEWSYDDRNKILKISSDYRYENRHHSLAPNQSYTTQQMIFDMSSGNLNVIEEIVFADGEVNIFTKQYGV